MQDVSTMQMACKERVFGDGLEVAGPGEALIMAMAARLDALNQLTGPGKSLLAQRI